MGCLIREPDSCSICTYMHTTFRSEDSGKKIRSTLLTRVTCGEQTEHRGTQGEGGGLLDAQQGTLETTATARTPVAAAHTLGAQHFAAAGTGAMVAEYRVCPAGEGALGTQEREAFSPHPSQFEVAAAAVQGPDVGIGTTVEDADELPLRHAAAASTLRCSTPPPLPHRRSLRAPRLDAAAASAHQYSTPPQLLRPASHLRAMLLAAAAALVPCIRRSGPPRSIPLAPPR